MHSQGLVSVRIISNALEKHANHGSTVSFQKFMLYLLFQQMFTCQLHVPTMCHFHTGLSRFIGSQIPYIRPYLHYVHISCSYILLYVYVHTHTLLTYVMCIYIYIYMYIYTFYN